jgi:ferric-dicitrate binding protein FerR (iron transport regulator)
VSAAAIGTEWATTLLCDGTRVTVREGRVRVRDKIRNRSVIVNAGQSFKVVTRGSRRGG